MKKIYQYKNTVVQLIIDEIPFRNDFEIFSDRSTVSMELIGQVNHTSIGLEIVQPRGGRVCYGMQVARILNTNNANEINISTNYTKNNTSRYEQSILENGNYVYKGLKEEYLSFAKEGIEKSLITKDSFPKCDLYFEYGANCEIGSSPMFFKLISETLVDIISLDNKSNIFDLSAKDFSQQYGHRFNLI